MTKTASKTRLSRRTFLVSGAAAGGGLALGFHVPGIKDAIAQQLIGAQGSELGGAWVVIKPNEDVVIRIARSEMGQGTLTGLAQPVCEELECDWNKVSWEYPTPGQNLAPDAVAGEVLAGRRILPLDLFQSHSSSSATSWARPVSVPWPISERAMRMTTSSLGLMTTQAPSSLPCAPMQFCASASRMPGTWKPSAKPPPAAAPETRNLRRETFGFSLLFSSWPFLPLQPQRRVASRHVDGGADALIGAAATDVGHGLVDVGIGGLGFFLSRAAAVMIWPAWQ